MKDAIIIMEWILILADPLSVVAIAITHKQTVNPYYFELTVIFYKNGLSRE